MPHTLYNTLKMKEESELKKRKRKIYQESYEDENGKIQWRNISNPDLAQSDTRIINPNDEKSRRNSSTNG